MPLLGAHMSIAGGLHLAFDRIRRVKGEAMQIFTANQRQWRSPAISSQSAEAFRSAWGKCPGLVVAAHDSYLINLASVDADLEERSVVAFAEELKRCALLSIPLLIAHLGSHLGRGLKEGLARFTGNLDRAIHLAEAENVRVLLETTAGQGSALGASFEEIAFVLETSRHGKMLGVCLDTCHVFAAGYDIRSPETYARTMAEFDQIVGIRRIQFFHLNDSRRELGSRVDRHEHIGRGEIGLEGFRCLLNDPLFASRPMVLETPKREDLQEDRRNLGVLRSLIRVPGPRGG
jgi:deoxyribonuclease-4